MSMFKNLLQVSAHSLLVLVIMLHISLVVIAKESRQKEILAPGQAVEKEAWEEKLVVACLKRAKILKRNQHKHFCECFAKNHILLAFSQDEDAVTAQEQLEWLRKAASNEFKNPSHEINKDPFALLGPTGYIEGIDRECKKNVEFRLDPKNPYIEP